MRVFNISDFKARCIAILKSVARKREPVMVTLRGKPVARVVPVEPEQIRRSLGALRGAVQINGDIVRSDFADDWEPADR